MDWSKEQDGALCAVANWLRMRDPDKPVFRLFGYAGTGKTTLAKHLAAGVDGDVLFAAFTGKAASVLRAKGCGDASTIHSLIYSPNNKSERRLKELRKLLAAHGPDPELERQIQEEEEALSRPSFRLRHEDSELRGASLLVVDECSMVGEQVARDLMSFGVPILVLGDPAQLPPVASGGYFTDHEPDVMLTEIHRQARDNPIIELATRVREGRGLKPGAYGDSVVAERGTRTPGERLLGADQLLVGRNKTRHALNAHCRKLLGRASWEPEPGDKVVCLRNDADLELLNGTLWTVEKCSRTSCEGDELSLKVVNEDGRAVYAPVHAAPFRGEQIRGAWFERKEAQEFDHGYALTTHKAQGSQWNDVIVYDESGAFRADADRWLYTAITRAAERVTVVPR